MVKGNLPSLLGRDWLITIKLNWSQIFSCQVNNNCENPDMKVLVDKFKHVFKNNGKPIKKYKAKLVLKQNAVPKFCRPRPIPYVLKNEVSKILDDLVARDIVVPVESTDWASPTVIVPKSSGDSVRLCGDYKVTINKHLIDPVYPMPTIQDIISNLDGACIFTKRV